MNNIANFILPIIIKNAFILINIVPETVESWIGVKIITFGTMVSCSWLLFAGTFTIAISKIIDENF